MIFIYIYIHTLYLSWRTYKSMCIPPNFQSAAWFCCSTLLRFQDLFAYCEAGNFREAAPCFGWMEVSKLSNQNQGANGEATPFRNSWDNPSWKLGLPSANNVAWMMDLLQLFSTTLLQSKQWCFDNKGNKWKHVSSMTSMYCFITDWFLQFFHFQTCEVAVFFWDLKTRCKLKWRSKSQQHFWPKIWCFKKPLQFCQTHKKNISKCLKSTCVLNFNQARVLVRSNQLPPPVAPFSRCVRWWPIILSSWVWLMHMAFQPYIMPWCRVTLSSFPRCLLKGGVGPKGDFWRWSGAATAESGWGINSLAFDRPAEMRWCVTAIGPSGTVYVREIYSSKSPQ